MSRTPWDQELYLLNNKYNIDKTSKLIKQNEIDAVEVTMSQDPVKRVLMKEEIDNEIASLENEIGMLQDRLKEFNEYKNLFK